jgi:hypothetical protein
VGPSNSTQLPQVVTVKRKRKPFVRKTDSVCSEICRRLAIGQSLKSICKDRSMPNIDTFFTWIQKDRSLSDRYARARELQADFLAEETLDLRAGVRDSEDAQVAKVKLDIVKWFASKVHPKKYGERSGDVHVTTAIGVVLPEEERQKLIERQRAAEAQLLEDPK